MDREKIILSDLDIKILNFLFEQKNVTQISDYFNFSFSQCKRHIDRIKKYVTKIEYGTFRLFKINPKGKKILEAIWFLI